MLVLNARTIRGHTICPKLLNSNSTVLDLGAHKAEFSQLVSARYGCKCFAVEASPDLISQIKESASLRKHNYAISFSDKPIDFHVSNQLEASSILALKDEAVVTTLTVPGITLESYIERYELKDIDLIKIDIEGAEKDLFSSTSDATLRKIPQISVEFHDFIEDFQLSEEVSRIKARLISLGFYCIVFTRSTNEDVLFLNKELCRLSYLNYLYLKYPVKYIKGLNRAIKRRLGLLKPGT